MEVKAERQKINRIKAVLAETGHTGKWLAEQLGKDPVTVSKWCTNSSQPDLGNLLRIADLLEVDIKELFIPVKIRPILKKVFITPKFVFFPHGQAHISRCSVSIFCKQNSFFFRPFTDIRCISSTITGCCRVR